MRKVLFIGILVSGQMIDLIAQVDTLEQINEAVEKTDLNRSLEVREFDADSLYKQVFDGGGTIKVYLDETGIRKIEEEIGVSFGRLTTIIYMQNGRPVKIIDREENFKWKEDNTGWDYSELNQVFEANIYIFNWELDQSKTFEKGKRNLSEGTCAVFECEPLIELVKELTE